MQDKDSDALLQTVKQILDVSVIDLEAQRRRLAADLAVCPVDQQAFDLALDMYDIEYHKCYDPVWGDESSHSDAQISALEAFLHTYLMEAGRWG